MTLTREQIAGLRDDLRRQQYNTIAVQRDDLSALLDIAEAVSTPCEWTLDDSPYASIWESACGESWSFTEGGPEDNNVRFCHGCGKPVAVLPLAGEVAK